MDELLYHIRKGVKYEHHSLFLQICVESDVVPKGLRIKKDPCIHDPSEEFSNEWKNVKRTEVREKVLWLMDVANTETNILTNRRKNKLNRLIYNFSPCKYDVFTQFSFDILSICEILFEEFSIYDNVYEVLT